MLSGLKIQFFIGDLKKYLEIKDFPL